MTLWTRNAAVYEMWLDREEASIQDLKDMLCQTQFGYNVSQCKVLWLPNKKTSYPLVVIPTVTTRELEEEALPKILGSWKRYFVENFESYGSVKDGEKLAFSAEEKLCCLLQ